MKRILLAWIVFAAAAFASDGRFSQGLTPDERASAGLDKLTPEQLAALDALVARDRSSATAAAEHRVKAEEKSTSFIGKARALITPGTRIEYQPVESRIQGRISGWTEHTIFWLENGQRWQVANYDRYDYGDFFQSPKVTIRPASMGGFMMEIEGLGRVRVRLLDDPQAQP